MTGNFGYKQKNLLLVGGVVLFWAIAYHLSFKKTIKLHEENKFIKFQLQQTQNAGGKIQELEDILSGMEMRYGLAADAKKTTHEFILGELTALCNAQDVALLNYPEMQKQVQNDFTIETNKIELSGGFLDVLALLHNLEKLRMGRISSVSFEKRKDLRTKKEYLLTQIYLQNIKLANEKF